jgi:hypothetical protein
MRIVYEKNQIAKLVYQQGEQHKVYEMIRSRKQQVEKIDQAIKDAEIQVLRAREKLQDLRDAKSTKRLECEISALEDWADDFENKARQKEDENAIRAQNTPG